METTQAKLYFRVPTPAHVRVRRYVLGKVEIERRSTVKDGYVCPPFGTTSWIVCTCKQTANISPESRDGVFSI